VIVVCCPRAGSASEATAIMTTAIRTATISNPELEFFLGMISLIKEKIHRKYILPEY
jgi:hypothetical protein